MTSLKKLASQRMCAAALQHAFGQQGAGMLRPATQFTQLASFTATATQSPSAAEGPLFSACVLERLPLVMPPPPEWVIEHAQWRQQLIQRYRKQLPGALVDPKRSEDAEAGPDGTARWQPAALETEADRSGDQRSLRRRLDQRIFMLVRPRQGGAGAPWEFPHVQLAAGETSRQGAERALAEAAGSEGMQPYFIGNAPAGHVSLPGYGTVFFHRCQLIQGKPTLAPGGAWGDAVWVAKDELEGQLKVPEMVQLLHKML